MPSLAAALGRAATAVALTGQRVPSVAAGVERIRPIIESDGQSRIGTRVAVSRLGRAPHLRVLQRVGQVPIPGKVVLFHERARGRRTG